MAPEIISEMNMNKLKVGFIFTPVNQILPGLNVCTLCARAQIKFRAEVAPKYAKFCFLSLLNWVNLHRGGELKVIEIKPKGRIPNKNAKV